MANVATTLKDALARLEQKRDGIFTSWAKTQTPFPGNTQSLANDEITKIAIAQYGYEAWQILLTKKADDLLILDLGAVVGPDRAKRIVESSRLSLHKPHDPTPSPPPKARPATDEQEATVSLTPVQKILLAVSGALLLLAIGFFWKLILGGVLIGLLVGGSALIVFTNMKKLGGGLLAGGVAVAALVGSLLPASADSESKIRSDPAARAETLCRQALEGERSNVGHDSIGEYTIDSGMNGTHFWDEAILRTDGAYSVEVTNKSDFTDSMCPVRVVGRCTVDGSTVTITQSFTRSGYIACG